ncbi:hypothetical protein KAR91_55405 [Candidatus Pacearchaeota archaeon]|nr:hypothetical protein [Candidatus Pacearchaeota archaeon]
MASDIQITNFTSATDTIAQDIDITDFGVPDAVLFFCNGIYLTGVTTLGTGSVNAVFGVGCTDKTRVLSLAGQDEDDKAQTDTGTTTDNTHCLNILNDANAVIASAVYTSASTAGNGIKITWDVNGLGTGVPITAVFFNVDSIRCDFKALSTEDTEVDVPEPTFEPDGVICFSGGQGEASAANGMRLSIGFIVNDGSETQRCLAVYSHHPVATSSLTAHLFTDRVCAGLQDGAITFEGEGGNFDADGFSLTARGGDSGGAVCFYLAFKLASGENKWVGTVNSPVSTGPDAQTGPNFQPIFVMELLSMLAAVDTTATDGTAGVFGVGVFDSQGTEYCHAITCQDGVGTTVTRSIHDDEAIQLNDHTDAGMYQAAFTSMDATGWTLNFSAENDDTVRKWPSLAIGTAAAVGLSIPIAQYYHNQARM